MIQVIQAWLVCVVIRPVKVKFISPAKPHEFEVERTRGKGVKGCGRSKDTSVNLQSSLGSIEFMIQTAFLFFVRPSICPSFPILKQVSWRICTGL
jgi:hypothetical protein